MATSQDRRLFSTMHSLRLHCVASHNRGFQRTLKLLCVVSQDRKLFSTEISDGSRIPGLVPTTRGRQSIFWPLFPKTAWKWRNFGQRPLALCGILRASPESCSALCTRQGKVTLNGLSREGPVQHCGLCKNMRTCYCNARTIVAHSRFAGAPPYFVHFPKNCFFVPSLFRNIWARNFWKKRQKRCGREEWTNRTCAVTLQTWRSSLLG